MYNRKFFSGLPEKMMTRNSSGLNRQQTHFYWPDDSVAEGYPTPRNDRMRNRCLSTASIVSQSQASTDTEESRRRRNRDMKSGIQFYDMVDTATDNDNESVYSRKLDPTKHKKQETLKSRIEFYDYIDTKKHQQQQPSAYMDEDVNSVIEVIQKKDNQEEIKNTCGTPEIVKSKIEVNVGNLLTQSNNKINGNDKFNDYNLNNNHSRNENEMIANNNSRKKSQHQQQNYLDSYSESDEDDYQRHQKLYRNREPIDRNLSQKYRRPPLQPNHQRPRRLNSQYYYDEFDDELYDSPYRRSRLARTSRRNFSPDVSDEEFFDDRSYARRDNRNYRNSTAFSPEREFRSTSSRYGDYYENLRDDRRSMSSRNINGYGNDVEYNNRKAESRVKSPPPLRQMTSEIESEFEQMRIPSNNTTAAARPPVKPVARSMSINEARRRHHVNLKSNIFHNDFEYDQVVEQKKPLSVRDFAANHRIGVGLPDLY